MVHPADLSEDLATSGNESRRIPSRFCFIGMKRKEQINAGGMPWLYALRA